MNIVDRLKLYMEHTGLPISQFADGALIPRPTLSQILSGRNKKISNEILEKLHAAYPSLNVAWLLFGDGNMLSGAAPTTAPATTPAQTQDNQPRSASVPYVAAAVANAAAKAAADQATVESPKPSVETQYEKNQEPTISLAPDTTKKIQTIMVFYTDNSFEIFTPAPR